MTSTPKLRIDRSKPYGEVHGERTPNDPHSAVFFFQDSMPFDAQGLLLYELITDEKVKKRADQLLKKAAKAQVPAEDGDGEGDDGGSSGDKVDAANTASTNSTEVNLESWLRGEANYQWAKITKTVRDRYHQNISKQADMVAFLVLDEKVIPMDQVAPDLAALLPKA